MPSSDAPTPLQRFLREMPKVEIHCHLLGTVRKATFAQLAARENAPLTSEEIEAFYTRGEKPVGVLRVLRALDSFLVKSPDDLHRITYEYLADAAAHGVHYSEFFWNPTGTARDSAIPYPQALAGIVRAIKDAEHDFKIIGKLIPAIDREAPASEAVYMVKEVIASKSEEVVGIGIDYRENDRPPELFADAYALARNAGLKTTAHAGEFGMPWYNVQTAVELLKVDRIDHGLAAQRGAGRAGCKCIGCHTIDHDSARGAGSSHAALAAHYVGAGLGIYAALCGHFIDCCCFGDRRRCGVGIRCLVIDSQRCTN